MRTKLNHELPQSMNAQVPMFTQKRGNTFFEVGFPARLDLCRKYKQTGEDIMENFYQLEFAAKYLDQ